MTKKELATILAALRFFQAWRDPEIEDKGGIYRDIVNDFFIEVPALTNGEVDDLCEELNTKQRGHE